MKTLHDRFEQFSDEHGKFARIESPRHDRPDICAFLMIHELAGGKGDIISASEHDQIWIDASCDKLNEVATDEQIRDLVRCGVMYDDDIESLSMFT